MEEIPNQLNESQLILDAGNVALTGYKLLGRGVICFFGEKPEYISRKEFIPDELLEVVDRHSLDQEYYELLEAIDGYSPEEEFIVIPSNQRSIKLITFTDIGIDLDKSISDEEYRQELEKVLVKLEQQGLDTQTINKLRKETLARRGQNTREVLAAYPPEMLAILQKCLEEEVHGNLKPFIDFCNLFNNI